MNLWTVGCADPRKRSQHPATQRHLEPAAAVDRMIFKILSFRERYQFWFFTSYDTGNPVLYSAALLREALRNALHKLDPPGVDPALSEIVVIGHSQGGLLTKAMVVDTGDRVWNAIANKPLDQIDLSPERRELLREAVFIKPVTNVRRVVFIATPHRGSYLTEYPVTELLGDFSPSPCALSRPASNLRAMPAISRSTHAISDRAACSA